MVLMPRRWHQLGDDASHHAGDGGKKARSPGRARKKPLKPFAQGMPGRSGVPVVTTLVCFFLSHARPRVQSAHPAFPAPSSFEDANVSRTTRAQRRRGNTKACLAESLWNLCSPDERTRHPGQRQRPFPDIASLIRATILLRFCDPARIRTTWWLLPLSRRPHM